MGLFNDFEKFATRGNMLQLAIGLSVGVAFSSLAKSLVDDLIMPPIGYVVGVTDFSNLFVVLRIPEGAKVPDGGIQTLAQAKAAKALSFNYGSFLNHCIAFLIVAFAMFLLIRIANRIDKELDEHLGEHPKKSGEPTNKKCQFCRSTIAFRATRCPKCTSELEPNNAPLVAAPGQAT